MSALIKQTVLVLGATGKQGGATVRALDATKFSILAVTRDASSDKAKALAASPGVQVVEGSLDEPAKFFEGKGPIQAVFAVVTDQNLDAHKRQTLALIDASVKHGVKHFVYSAMDFMGKEVTGIPYFDLKKELIQYIEAQPFDHTILGPVGFMENFYWPLYLDQVTTTWPKAKGQQFGLIATEDIGKVAAKVIANPDRYKGKTLYLAGDSLTGNEIAAIWKEVTGVTLKAEATPVFPPPFNASFQFFNDNTCEADVQENRQDFPFIKDFKTWLQGSAFAKAQA